MRALALAAALLAAGQVPTQVTAQAGAQCRQALALGLDVSGSVDSREYRLQLDGLADALDDPRVAASLLAPPGIVQLAIFEWSGPDNQHILVGWTAIDSRATLQGVTSALRATDRRTASFGTALGQAMLTGAGLLAQQRGCWKRTLDLSGDGKHNTGPDPRRIRQSLDGSVTVNALVIGADSPSIGDTRQVEIAELSAYFHANVITGPGAFVETALGFEDFRKAMTRKLLRELETLALSAR